MRKSMKETINANLDQVRSANRSSDAIVKSERNF